MAQESFQFTVITRVLADDVDLSEALGFPEISSLGDTERRCQAALQAKAKAILEDSELSPAVSLHRRRIVVEPELAEVEVTLEPAKRMPEWQKPLSLRLPVVRWVEEGELHQAYVPALGILVFALRKTQLDERIKAHVRLVLQGRKKKLGLRDLVHATQIESLKLKKLELTAKMVSPKEAAASRGVKQEKSSMLV